MAFPGMRFLALLLLCGAVLATVDLDKMEGFALSRYGPNTARTVADWRSTIEAIKSLSDQQKVERVNTFINSRVRWVEDIDNWRQPDYWATPLETLAKQAGDCEDFSILKYVTLLLAGVDMNKLRITYVKANINGRDVAHMVLAYYPQPSAEPLILDNMMDMARPASSRTDLKPVYGFNSNGLWVGGAAKPQVKDPGAKLSRWRDLLQRMSADGLG
jgi:predicted transglutaminase-like cysteine proteinase